MGGYATNLDTNSASEITGSGTANYLARFTSAQVIGNSGITDDGAILTFTRPSQFNDTMYVGPEGILTWSSSTAFSIYATVSDLNLVTSAAKPIVMFNAGTETMRLFSDNNVSIGYGIATTARLQVVGSTNDSAAHSFKALSLDLSNLLSVRNDGIVNVGNYASPGNLRRFTVGQDTAFLTIGSLTSATSQSAIYMNQATPGSTNYSLTADSATTVLNGATSLALNVAAIARMNFAGAGTSGSTTKIAVTQANSTGQTASTEVYGTLWATGTRQWATGAITTQREFRLQSPTYSFVGASTITNAYTLYVEAPTASTNATITNNYALGVNARILSESTTVNVGLVLSRSTVGGFFQADSGAVLVGTSTAHNVEVYYNNTKNFTIGSSFTFTDAINMVVGTTTGTKIGTATTQKIGLWNATPIVQPTTAVTAATFVANASANALYNESTFDGYTIGQAIKALRNIGALA